MGHPSIVAYKSQKFVSRSIESQAQAHKQRRESNTILGMCDMREFYERKPEVVSEIKDSEAKKRKKQYMT